LIKVFVKDVSEKMLRAALKALLF